MIIKVLPYLTFRYNALMILKRLFPMYLKRCDSKGNYDKNKNLKFYQKFFKNPIINKEIKNCEEGLINQTALDSCLHICQRFSPLKYD